MSSSLSGNSDTPSSSCFFLYSSSYIFCFKAKTAASGLAGTGAAFGGVVCLEGAPLSVILLNLRR